MNCNVAIMLMHDYLDDELPHDDMAELRHILFPARNAAHGSSSWSGRKRSPIR